MANTIPSQVRAVDPYAEFNSNSVNVLTRMVSKGTDCILSAYKVDVISDSTSPLDHAVVTTGLCIKDDTLIRILANLRVDFTDPDFYINSVPPFNEAGNYYVVLNYTYAKSKPAPQASISILKPSQHALLTDAYLLLKVINVIYTGAVFNISTFSDYDDLIPTNKVSCSHTYATLEPFLPSYNYLYDMGRIVFDESLEIPYIGTNYQGWVEFGTFDYPCDTSLCSVGQLVYIGGGNIAQPAIASNIRTFATAFVLSSSTTGRVRVTGVVDGGLVQTGIVLAPGDTLYLSNSEAGKVTNTLPVGGNAQIIGTCITTTGSNYRTVLASLSGVEGNLYHNSLLGLQGGTTNQFYHLTSTQLSNIGDGTHNGGTGLQGGDGVNYYHVGHTTFHNIGDGTHNQISGVEGGDSTHAFHFTLTEHTALVAFGGNHNSCPTGLQGGNTFERYHFTQLQHDNLGDGTHNGGTGLQGGAAGERYHLTHAQWAAYSTVDNFPSGTRLLFPARGDAGSAAPPGWTQVISISDSVIKVTNGTPSLSMLGSWVISGLSSSLHHHSTGGHSLSMNEMPEHNHSVTSWVGEGGTNNGFSGSYTATPTITMYTNNTGGSGTYGVGDSHSHGNTGDTAANISCDGTWRPKYIDVIIAQKN